jgi:Mrp family chromosome partitioning ATPase
MQQFMAKAVEMFDLVIYDMPPLLGLSDVYFLAPHTDGLLLVVHLHRLKRVLLEQTMEELQVPAVPILGVVANASDEGVSNNSNYHSRSDLPPGSGAATLPGLVRKTKQLLEKLHAL